MTIALLSAMEDEILPLLDYFHISEKVETANTTYYLSQFQEVKLVIASSNVGKINAAISTTLLIERFQADIILFSGVAGSINPSLKIGDLILATQLVQYDLDITACGHPVGFAPNGKVFIDTDKKLREICKEVASEQKISLKEGIIATGDQFVNCKEKKRWIAETFNAEALEMEGVSVASVCQVLNIPCCILRSISDSADNEADVHYSFNMQNSAQKSAKFIISVLEKILNQKTLQQIDS